MGPWSHTKPFLYITFEFLLHSEKFNWHHVLENENILFRSPASTRIHSFFLLLFGVNRAHPILHANHLHSEFAVDSSRSQPSCEDKIQGNDQFVMVWAWIYYSTAASLDALKEQSDPLIFTVPNDFITFTYVLTVFYLSALLTIAVYLLKKRNRE